MVKKIETNADKKIARQKKLLIVICIVFIGAIMLYCIGGSNKGKVTKNERKESLIKEKSFRAINLRQLYCERRKSR